MKTYQYISAILAITLTSYAEKKGFREPLPAYKDIPLNISLTNVKNILEYNNEKKQAEKEKQKIYLEDLRFNQQKQRYLESIKDLPTNAVYFCGVVWSIYKDGMLLKSPLWTSEGLYNVNDYYTYHIGPKLIEGNIYLIGHTNQHNLVDGVIMKIYAIPDGVERHEYKYDTLTYRKYKFIRSRE